MSEKISLYNAKATLSALVRQVREGRSYTITVHGQPVAELRPFEPPPVRTLTLVERIAELEAQGVIAVAEGSARDLAQWPIQHRVNGALERFLSERE
jgi:prevent-host-death family protein